jgi:nicotinamidase/pyrazinamidase
MPTHELKSAALHWCRPEGSIHMPKKPIDLEVAKSQVARINAALDKPHLLIGGLAVNRYVPIRNSKDIDLVCEYGVAQRLVKTLYPSDTWTVEEVHDDSYRPSFRVTHQSEDFGEIVFGPKILEREPYSFIDWDLLLKNGESFEYQGKILDKIMIPACPELAFTKLISFLGRDRLLTMKREQDLDDLTELSNNKKFTSVAFLAAILRARAYDYILTNFELSPSEHNVFERSTIFRQNALFGGIHRPEPRRGTTASRHTRKGRQKKEMPLIEKEVVNIALKHGDKKPSSITARDVLVVVDVQLDFFKGGALAANDSESLIDPLNRLLHQAEESGVAIVFTRDWHPADHWSFDDWGVHCVKDSEGAKFHPDLYKPKNALVLDIGVDNFVDGYSPFDDIRLISLLVAENIRTVYITGMALEFCVLATCRDAAWFGKTVVAIEPLIRAADPDPAKKESVWELITSMGVVRAQNISLPGLARWSGLDSLRT